MSHIRIPHYRDGLFLIISVVHLSTEQLDVFRSQLAESLQDLETPPSPLVIGLPENKEEEETAADLYMVASLSKRRGWKRLYVLDSMSRRLISGSGTWWIDAENSFGIVIETHWQGKHGALTRTAKSSIFAWRASITEVVGGILSTESEERPEKLSDYEIMREPPDQDRMLRFNYGLELLDPNKPLASSAIAVTSTDKQSATANKDLQQINTALSNIADYLPIELRVRIADYAQEGLRPDQLTSAPAELNWTEKNMHIQVMAPIPDDEYQRLESECLNTIRAVDSDATCTLHKWTGIQTASLAQLWRVWDRLLEANAKWHEHVILFFIYPADWLTDKTRISMISNLDPYYPALRRPIFLEAINYLKWYKSPKGSLQRPTPSVEVEYEEIQNFAILDQPFHSFQPWPSFTSKGLELTLPIFHLVRGLTSDDIAIIDESLAEHTREMAQYNHGNPDDGVVYATCHIFWDNDTPGNDEEAFKILYKCYYKTFDTRPPQMAVFIPKTFHRDNKVWLAQLSIKYISHEQGYLINEPVRGMYFNRIDVGLLPSIWVNYEIANIGIDEVGGLYTYLRPGYTLTESDTDFGGDEDDEDDEDEENEEEGDGEDDFTNAEG